MVYLHSLVIKKVSRCSKCYRKQEGKTVKYILPHCVTYSVTHGNHKPTEKR